jgi:hypothetical protein
MNKKFTITVYADPGHAWGKIKREVLLGLGVEHLISEYSYQLRDNVYLEEDCDLGLVVDALKMSQCTVIFREKTSNNDSKIRGYERFSSILK